MQDAWNHSLLRVFFGAQNSWNYIYDFDLGPGQLLKNINIDKGYHIHIHIHVSKGNKTTGLLVTDRAKLSQREKKDLSTGVSRAHWKSFEEICREKGIKQAHWSLRAVCQCLRDRVLAEAASQLSQWRQGCFGSLELSDGEDSVEWFWVRTGGRPAREVS